MFLLDTNAIIAVLTERVPAVAQRLDGEVAKGSTILLSTIVLHELLYGIEKSARRIQNEALLQAFLELPIEPPPDCRRPFGLSYAAMAGSSSMA